MSYQTFNTTVPPSAPAAGKTSDFASSVNKRRYYINEDGLITPFGPCISATTSASSAINTTETAIAGGNAINGGTCQIPLNTLTAQSTFRILIYGTCTSTAANTSTFTGRFGTTGSGTSDASLFTVTYTAAASGTSISFVVEILFTVRTSGSSGTIAGWARLDNNGTTGIVAVATPNVQALSTSTLNTTNTGYLSVTYKSSATTTTCTFQNATVEQIR